MENKTEKDEKKEGEKIKDVENDKKKEKGKEKEKEKEREREKEQIIEVGEDEPDIENTQFVVNDSGYRWVFDFFHDGSGSCHPVALKVKGGETYKEPKVPERIKKVIEKRLGLEIKPP